VYSIVGVKEMPEAATFEQALRAPSEKGNAQFTQWVSKLFREIAKLKSRNARVFLNPCRTHLEVRIQPNPTELSLQAFPKKHIYSLKLLYM